MVSKTSIDVRLKTFLMRSRTGRTLIGSALVVGGLLGFLPVLGFWMIPLGLIVLSQDFPAVMRFRRRWTVRLGRLWQRFRPSRKRAQITK